MNKLFGQNRWLIIIECPRLENNTMNNLFSLLLFFFSPFFDYCLVTSNIHNKHVTNVQIDHGRIRVDMNQLVVKRDLFKPD